MRSSSSHNLSRQSHDRRSSFASLLASALLLGIFAFVANANEEETEATERTAIINRIDELLFDTMQVEEIEPANAAGDSEFLRRIYLDLAGSIPTVSHTREYLTDESPDKKTQLIERLLTSPSTVNRLAETWRNAMLPPNASPETFRNSAGMHNWLREQFSENMRYDRIVSDLIAATGSEQDGPALFFTALELEPKKIAASTARIFLGLQIECAECHDHPFDDWKQEDFWGYAAFFARLPKNDNMVRASNFRLSDRSSGDVTLPDTEDVVLPKYPGGQRADENDLGTRRQQLSIWMASPDNPYLARAAVNRVWALLFGRGLVNPVDDLGPHNPASHPKLLDALTDYFVDSGYDLKNLLRVLCNTEAYGRTSAIDPAKKPPVDLFAAMAVKVQTAEQLYDSLSRCLSQDRSMASPFPGVATNGSRQQFLARMASRSADTTEYDRGLQQALLLMNGSETAEATNLDRSPLLTSLEAPFLTDKDRVDVLYLATLSRLPTDSERSTIKQFIADAGESEEEQKAARADALWALLNSAEFTMNK